MNSIQILANGMYLPENKIDNNIFNERFELDKEWIYKRTGIKQRYYAKSENLVDISLKAVKNLLKKTDIDVQQIGIIVVATTSTDELMPGISFQIQKKLDIKKCICFDVLAGCSGYINAFDIVRKYIALGEVKYGLVIGTEILSKYINETDIDTAILLGDGAGATLLGEVDNEKLYFSNIESQGQYGEILTCTKNETIYMNGKKIYKFGITKTVDNIKVLLEKSGLDIEEIKYIIPHQSNLRIIETIAEKLGVSLEKMLLNIQYTGNTFCASIPIVLNEIYEKLESGDKIILIGYGGGLNLGSILIER